MKRVKLTVLSLFLIAGVSSADSSKTDSINYHKNDRTVQDLAEKDLEVEIAIEDFFDEEATAHESKKMRRKYDRETNGLRRKITKLNGQSKRLKKKNKVLNGRFDESYKIHNRVQLKADAATTKTDRISNKVNKLQNRVDHVEQKAIQARKKLDQMKQSYTREVRRQTRLNKRRKNALRIIRKYEKQMTRLKKGVSSIKKKNGNLVRKVDQLEVRAIALHKQVRQ